MAWDRKVGKLVHPPSRQVLHLQTKWRHISTTPIRVCHANCRTRIGNLKEFEQVY